MAEQTLSKLAKDIWPHLIHRVEAATKHGRGGSGTTGGGGGSDLTAHAGKDYIEAHPTNDPAINRNGTYYSYGFGITGGISTDEANNLTLMFDAVGQAGGGTIIVRSTNGTDPIYLSKLATLGYSNVNVKFISPVVYGADGGLRIMGELSLTAPRPGNLSCNLASNSYEDVNGRTVLPLRPGHGAFLSVGDTIVIRGLNDITGKAVQRDISVVYAIAGDDVTVVDELEYEFQDTYTATDSPITSSDWGPDATTGTTIYIWDGSLFTGNITAGAMTVVVADASVFSVGDLVIVRDNRTEWDMNNSAIRSSLLPYRNAANQEMAKVLAVDVGTDTVTLDHALTRSYLTANYGGLFVILPVENSSISGARITYIADQVTRSSHSLQIFYAENCHVFDNHIDGSGGRRGQAIRISTSYQCSAYRNYVDTAKFNESGDGYGISVYNGATFTRIYNNVVTHCRHSILLQCATHTSIYGNESRDDLISGIDLHGVLSIGTHIFGNFITRSNGNTTDSSNGSGIRIGNTSHTCGDLDTTVEDNFIIGYFTGDGTESAIDFIPASKGLVLRNNTLVDCSDGIRFTRNSSHITPTQTAENISIEGNTLRRCAVPFDIDGASTGFISKLTVKGNISDGNTKHFVFIDVLVALNCCDNIIINPVATTGEYGYSFLRVDGLLCDNNRAHKANKGIYLKNCASAVVTNNILTATIDVVPFLDDGGNTSLIYVNNIDANVSVSDEAAQDAVGTILVDTATIDFTYTDATPSITADVINDSITNAKLANVATSTIKGRSTAGTGDPEDLTASQAATIIAAAAEFVEAAQDAIGAALVDTATIDLTYTDATPAITADVIDDSITFAKMQNITTDRLLGRDTASSGNTEEISLGASLEFSGSGSIQRAALTGDVTAAANGNATTIANDAVTNAKLANMAASTFKGRVTASTGDPEDMTVAQAHSLLVATGTWTPTIAGSTTAGTHTYTTQVGTYVKIGTLVLVQFNLKINAKDGAMAGNVRIAGYPFTSKNTTNAHHAVNIGYWGSLATSIVRVHGLLSPNNTVSTLYLATAAAATVTIMVTADVQNGTELIGSCVYQADA